MQNSMMLLTFFVFDWKYSFWANLVQKVKIISFIWNLVPKLVRVCRIQWWCSLFWFLTGNTLFGQIWSIWSELSDQAEIVKTLLWKLINIFLQNDKAAWEKLKLYYLSKKKASPTCHASLKLRRCLNGKYS